MFHGEYHVHITCEARHIFAGPSHDPMTLINFAHRHYIYIYIHHDFIIKPFRGCPFKDQELIQQCFNKID